MAEERWAKVAPTNQITEALVKLQAELPDVIKAEEAEVVSQRTGAKYKYKYADLSAVSDVILPKLAGVGLAFTALPTFTDDARFVLRYSLLHTSGESLSGDYPLPDPDKKTPQDIGSAITYARRYALLAVTGLAPKSDDDDAAKATKAHERERERELANSAETLQGQIEAANDLETLRAVGIRIRVAVLADEAKDALRDSYKVRETALKAPADAAD